MNVFLGSDSSREQITAEIAEMRKASREILASPRKRLEFLRRVGVLNTPKKRQGARPKAATASRRH